MHQLSHQPRQDKNESAIRACRNTQPSQTIVHAKLEMTTPGDYDEKEADAMADTVVNGGTIRREISNGASGGGVAVSIAMESQLAQAKGGGRTMPDGLRNMMESGFRRDFSNVKIHTDSQAEAMNNSLSAKAFTLGNDIYFNKGQFSPNTREGQHLMAHELTHVVQGCGEKIKRFSTVPIYISPNIDYLITDIEWIRNSVLGAKYYRKLIQNYEENGVRKPVIIVVLTTKVAACNSDLSKKQCAFEELDSGGPIMSLLDNAKEERVIIIQGVSSLNDLKNKVDFVNQVYGPIKDVVFRGHGNSEEMVLGNGDINMSTNNPIVKIKSSDVDMLIHLQNTMLNNNDERMRHTIVFGGCLTDSDHRNGLSHNIRNIIDNRIVIQGNEASVNTDEQEFEFDDNRKLILKNTKDITATSTGDSPDYNGGEKGGVIKNMIYCLENGYYNALSDKDYCTSKFLFFCFDDSEVYNVKVTDGNTNTTYDAKIDKEELSDSVISYAKGSNRNQGKTDRLIRLLKIIDSGGNISNVSRGFYPKLSFWTNEWKSKEIDIDETINHL